MKDDKLYLIHIKECIERIEQYSTGGKDAFLSDIKTQDAVLRNLQILAESSQRLSSEFKAKHIDINWQGISGFRNVLVHGYLGINPVRVWKIIENDITVLRQKIKKILDETDEKT